MPIPRQRHKFLKTRLLEQFSMTLKGDELLVHRVVSDTNVIKVPTDARLKSELEKMNTWGRPWDNFEHVVSELKKGRTYMIRNGMKDWARFAD